MARPRFSLKRTLLLSTFAALSLFSVAALAQDDSSNTGPSPTTNQPEPSANQPTTNNPPDNTPTPAESSPNDAPSDSPTPTSAQDVVITGGSSATGGGGLTSAPPLTRGPTTRAYPPPTPPPTADAPFMHRSSLPDGTVFIAVGAILGAFGLAVLVWRAIVACLLHRSVARAAAAQHAANDKAALFTTPAAPFYQQTAGSMERTDSPSGFPAAAAPGRGARRTTRGPIPSATPSMTNLFFSPTANGGGVPNAADRNSRYLPSGFYAAAGTAPTGSLTNLRPEDSPRAYGHHTNSSRHTLDPSPPPSPRLAMPRDTRDLSSTSLTNPNSPGVRAPSAYLDDLLADNQGAFPPAQMPAQRDTHNRHTSYGSNRL
jgi:hypothetical protein